MQTAAGIIALIAGVFGVLAAIVTLMVGGLGAAFQAHDALTVVYLGLGGVAFSFATIVLGAVAISAKNKVPGTLLMVSSIAGAILGGTLVAICMVLAFIGGLLAIIGTKRSESGATV
jgi:hypothetical protein